MQVHLDNIKFIGYKGLKAEITCFKVLREIKGLRVTFDSEYKGRPAITKCFKDIFGWFRCLREKRGLETLSKRGILAPVILGVGRTSQGWHCLIIEKIENSLNAYKSIMQTDSQETAKLVLFNTIRCLAKMHDAGIVQNDMHLGNFLVHGSNIYAIDPGRMRFYGKPVSLKMSFLNLGVMVMRLPDPVLHLRKDVLKLYCEVRGIAFSPKVESTMEASVAESEQRNADRLARRVVRPNKRVLLLEKGGYKGIFSQVYFTKDEAGKFIDEFDFITGEGGCGQYHAQWNGRSYRIHCYAPASPLVGFLNRLVPHRAVRLAFINPARHQWVGEWKKYWCRKRPDSPAALIEQYCGLSVKKSWFIEQI